MRRRRGAALILVLGTVSVMTVLAVELASRASGDVLRTGRVTRDAGFRRLADSGAEAARGLLLEREPKEFVSWGDSWNQPLSIKLAEDEKAEVRLADESGKIWIGGRKPEERGLARARVARLFEYLNRRDKRWKGVEAKVLGRLSRELMTLDGLREAGLSPEDVAALAPYLTCFGNGTVNLNTAARAVLFALDEEMDEAQVERIASYRGKGEGEKGTYRAFEDAKDLMLVDGIVVRRFENGEFRVTRNLFDRLQGSLAVTSSAFSARVVSEVRGRRREIWFFFKPDTTRLAAEEIVP